MRFLLRAKRILALSAHNPKRLYQANPDLRSDRIPGGSPAPASHPAKQRCNLNCSPTRPVRQQRPSHPRDTSRWSPSYVSLHTAPRQTLPALLFYNVPSFLNKIFLILPNLRLFMRLALKRSDVWSESPIKKPRPSLNFLSDVQAWTGCLLGNILCRLLFVYRTSKQVLYLFKNQMGKRSLQAFQQLYA